MAQLLNPDYSVYFWRKKARINRVARALTLLDTASQKQTLDTLNVLLTMLQNTTSDNEVADKTD